MPLHGRSYLAAELAVQSQFIDGSSSIDLLLAAQLVCGVWL